MLPFGAVCFLLAVAPDDAATIAWAVPGIALAYLAYAGIMGALAAFVAGGPLFICCIVLAGVGVLASCLCASALRVPKEQPASRLARLWLTTRAFFVVLSIVLFALVGVDAGRSASAAAAWGVLAAVNLVLAAATTPKLRGRLCVWIAEFGRGGRARVDATEAAKMIWLDLAAPISSHASATAGSEMVATSAK